ncbi:MAG: hypothetical protein NTX03_04690 [Bacteroidetes bacterium]|nr:hypothetical protein [Bacteroidota bacterium]
MKLKLFLFSIIALVFVAGFTSCSHEAVIPESPIFSFSKNVQPIIVGSCAQGGCHDGSGKRLFRLLNYTDISKQVIAKNAKSSTLYQAITGDGKKLKPAPPLSPLSDESIKTIYLWIMQGAKNN